MHTVISPRLGHVQSPVNGCFVLASHQPPLSSLPHHTAAKTANYRVVISLVSLLVGSANRRHLRERRTQGEKEKDTLCAFQFQLIRGEQQQITGSSPAPQAERHQHRCPLPGDSSREIRSLGTRT